MAFSIPPAAAEPVFHVGNFLVTNTLINSWIAVGFFILVTIALQKTSVVPKGLQNVAEGLVQFMLSEIEKITDDAKRARQFFPIVGTIFVFILFSNWLGLLPGIGSIGFWEMNEGHKEFIPILRSAASDVNMTLAIAVFAIVTSHIIGLKSVGFSNHVSKFVNLRGIWRALKKGPMDIIVAIIEFGVGIIEIVSEFAKVVSLSLRLFGNVFAGEVLMTVMLGLFSYFLPIPFIFLELLVGVVQATVFSMLTLAYLTVATTSHDDHEEEHSAEHDSEHAEAHA